MKGIHSILDNYRNGDFEQRLTLFLNYRDIRDEFIKIDEAELTANRRPGGAVPNEGGGYRPPAGHPSIHSSPDTNHS